MVALLRRLLPPPNAKVKNDWSYTSAPPMRFRGVGRDYFSFYCMTERTPFRSTLQ